MEIAKQLAGFSPAEADDLRKAIGKKIHALMASLKDKFLEGCAANGVTPAVANQLWKDMEQAQDYSFNKSHAACYALIAYRTAYLKANQPAEYMAALISSVMNTKDKVPFYVAACDEMGIEVQPPDVNVSAADFARRRGQDPLRAERGQERGRDGGARDRRRARGGRPVQLALGLRRARRPAGREQAGAREPRQVRRARLDERVAEGHARGARAGPGLGWAPARRPPQRPGLDLRPRAEEGRGRAAQAPSADSAGRVRQEGAPRRSRRRASASTSPSTRCRASRTRSGGRPTAAWPRSSGGATARSSPSAGIVGALKQLTTKKGEPMVFLRLDDLSGSIETVVFNSVYASARELLEADRMLVVKGRVDHKEGETKLIAHRGRPVRGDPRPGEVRLRLDARKAPAGPIRDLADVVRELPRRGAGRPRARDLHGAPDATRSGRTSACGPSLTSSPR